MERKFTADVHGVDLASGGSAPGQPAVGSDPTQGPGTSAWQQAVRISLELNARNRRN